MVSPAGVTVASGAYPAFVTTDIEQTANAIEHSRTDSS